jgi:hypothetical protein
MVLFKFCLLQWHLTDKVRSLCVHHHRQQLRIDRELSSINKSICFRLLQRHWTCRICSLLHGTMYREQFGTDKADNADIIKLMGFENIKRKIRNISRNFEIKSKINKKLVLFSYSLWITIWHYSSGICFFSYFLSYQWNG